MDHDQDLVLPVTFSFVMLTFKSEGAGFGRYYNLFRSLSEYSEQSKGGVVEVENCLEAHFEFRYVRKNLLYIFIFLSISVKEVHYE